MKASRIIALAIALVITFMVSFQFGQALGKWIKSEASKPDAISLVAF